MTIKKAAGLLCCAALIFTMAGCKKNENTVAPADKSSTEPAKMTTQVTQTGVVGEETAMADVEINVSKIYRSEYFGSQDGVLSNILFLEVTVTNNTDKEIDSNMLTSFEFEVDGELHDSATLLALSSTKKQFGNDVNLFTESLKPGDSQTGYIPAELPRNFDTVKLSFMPLGGVKGGGDTSKAIVYTFTVEDTEDIAKPQAEEKTEADAEKAD